MLVLSQAAALDQTGEAMKLLVKNMRFDELTQWFNDAFQYDVNGLKANTEKDEIAKENAEKMKQINEMIQLNPTEDVQNA
jgi:hypothetical protein